MHLNYYINLGCWNLLIVRGFLSSVDWEFPHTQSCYPRITGASLHPFLNVCICSHGFVLFSCFLHQLPFPLWCWLPLGKVNGIDIAHYLLEQNPQCIIVFVTGYYQYIHQSFKLRICNFIHKPFEDREFELVYYQALELYQRRNSTFTFNTSKGKQIFNPFDILDRKSVV